jgi:CheY-like chemotaxis protein
MLRVLVVEDYKDSAESLAMMLQLHGYHVDVAYDGASGLEAVERNWPDIAMVDLGLPMMDGFEVAKRIRLKAVGKRKPILIAITGYGDEAVRLRCQAEGFDRHLVKPADPFELLKIIKEVSTELNGFSEAC